MEAFVAMMATFVVLFVALFVALRAADLLRGSGGGPDCPYPPDTGPWTEEPLDPSLWRACGVSPAKFDAEGKVVS